MSPLGGEVAQELSSPSKSFGDNHAGHFTKNELRIVNKENTHTSLHRHLRKTTPKYPLASSPSGKFINLSSSTSQPSSNPTNKSGANDSEYFPSPMKTRAQRKKGGTNVLPFHKQKKLSKTIKNEANALSRLSKPNSTTARYDPDEFQWKLLLADQKKRENVDNANVSLQIPIEKREIEADTSDAPSKTWKVCVYAQNQIDKVTYNNQQSAIVDATVPQ
ncbi:hypothetical protein LguiA_021089 [Lonicera macranthoides]